MWLSLFEPTILEKTVEELPSIIQTRRPAPRGEHSTSCVQGQRSTNLRRLIALRFYSGVSQSKEASDWVQITLLDTSK